MDRISEVDRGRAARQSDEAPLRREAEHLILKQLEFGVLEELVGIVGRERFDDLSQAAIGGALAAFDRRAAVLVERMRGDAVFGDFVHAMGSDLQLDALHRPGR